MVLEIFRDVVSFVKSESPLNEGEPKETIKLPDGEVCSVFEGGVTALSNPKHVAPLIGRQGSDEGPAQRLIPKKKPIASK